MGIEATDEPRFASPFIKLLAAGAHYPRTWWIPPIRTFYLERFLDLVLNQSRLRSNQHSPPRSHLNSKFVTELSTHFIIDQQIEKLCHSSQLRAMRLNNYHAHFYSEIDSYLILDP
jgi:hypothetical protein